VNLFLQYICSLKKSTKTLKMGKIINLKKGLNKGKFFVIAISLLFAMESWAQNSAKTTVNILENSSSKLRVQINPGNFVSETVYRNKSSFVRIAVEGLDASKVTGCPELPEFQTLINIPVCDGMTYRVIRTNEITMPLHTSGYPMMPAQPSRSKSDKSPVVFEKNNQVYQQNKFWSPDVKVEKLGVMRNTTIGRIAVSPFSYNPVTGQIKKATSIEIEITFNNPNVQATEEMFSKYDDIYSGGIQSTMLNSRVASATKDAHTSGPLHYVIVSSPTFQAALQPLITWKKKKGYIVTEAYTNNAAVGTTTTTIKAYLKGLYDNASATVPAPTFVLFVGDVAQIPSYTGTTSAAHITDLYYCDWTGDYLPECYYGRFSGTTAQEITNQVSKTVEYEKYLMADPSFLNKMVIIAGQDATYGPTHGDGQLNYVKNTYFTAPFTTYSYPFAVSASSSSDIIAKVNAGVSIANYSAHGDWDGWADPSFNVTNVASMNNAGKYPLMIGNCCLTNKFDEPACFGEALLRGQNKGAIGYIGGSNSTYWDEDFYFACGFKTVTLTAPYSATGLGAFDRLFHTHGETYADQYITSGQILRAGNMAVTQSGSGYTKYYWEIYHLMGDPSLMPYLGVPTTMTPTYNGILPLNSTTLAVTTGVPYSYVAVSMGTTLLGATFANATGLANVPLSGVTTPGSADVVVTAQNKQPFLGTITVQTPTGPYVSMTTEVVVDATGNNNGVIDYNENAGFNVTLKNLGVAVANSVQAKLTTTSPYVTMTDSLETYGNIAVDASVLKTNAFAFLVSNNIPDGTSVTFNLTITDNASNSWTSTITKTVNAPAFQIGAMTINDAAGNNNQRLDAGETVQVTISGANIGHATASTVIGTLTTTTPGITITASPDTIGAVAASGAANATFQIAVGASVPNPTNVVLNYHVGEEVYYAEKTFTSTTGLVSEDYETGDFTRFSWVSTGGTLPWTVVNTGQYEGAHCSKSGAISNSQTSVMQVTMTAIVSDSISFYNKVSSEEAYDFLEFYIDGVKKGSWSGEVPWQRVAYPVAAGSHIYKWQYKKDNSQASGSDCAWVDFILFPPAPSPACPTPNSLSLISATTTTATLGWSSTAPNFNVRYRAVGTTIWNTTTAGASTLPVAGLTANTQYEFQVQTICSATAGDTSAWASVMTFSTLDICDVPTALLATNISETSADIGWVSTAANFNIRYRVVGATIWTATTTSANINTLIGLTANTQYEYQVQAICSAIASDTSDWAAVANFSTLVASACATPTALTTTNINQISATLGWTSTAANFNVRYRAVGTATWTSTTAASTALPISGLTANTQYEFKVQSICSATAGDTSNWSYTGNFTTLPICGIPTVLTATSIAQTSATLGWTSTAANFNVRYRAVGTATWTTTTAATTTLPVTGLTANTQYEFQVQTICSATAGDTSAWASAVNFTTIATCNAPTALVVSAINAADANLNWTAGGTETAWNIRYKKVVDATYTNVNNTTTKPYVLTGLQASTAYVWNVQAVCSVSLSSAWSADNTFTTTVGIESNSLNDLSVYSYNDKVNVMNNGNILVKEVIIYDIIGQEVGRYGINSTDNILINANLNTGNYVVKLITSQQVGTYKLFIKSLK
jgi:hypothetical protein